MKAGECLHGDLVRYDGDKFTVLKLAGDSVSLLNHRTQREIILSKWHSVTMIERKRMETPTGHEWRVYRVEIANRINRRPVKKGMCYNDAQAFIKNNEPKPGFEFVVYSGRPKRAQII